MKRMLFSWCSDGIETIYDFTDDYTQAVDFDRTKIFDIIKDPNDIPKNSAMTRVSITIDMILLRARMNPQRYYEVYHISCDDQLDEKFWEREWTERPQMTAELIRDRGVKLYSDRNSNKTPVIT